ADRHVAVFAFDGHGTGVKVKINVAAASLFGGLLKGLLSRVLDNLATATDGADYYEAAAD
ncbi:MAG: hypothetical protein ACKOW5_06285, partial [Actinomycetales bacterium]